MVTLARLAYSRLCLSSNVSLNPLLGPDPLGTFDDDRDIYCTVGRAAAVSTTLATTLLVPEIAPRLLFGTFIVSSRLLKVVLKRLLPLVLLGILGSPREMNMLDRGPAGLAPGMAARRRVLVLIVLLTPLLGTLMVRARLRKASIPLQRLLVLGALPIILDFRVSALMIENALVLRATRQTWLEPPTAPLLAKGVLTNVALPLTVMVRLKWLLAPVALMETIPAFGRLMLPVSFGMNIIWFAEPPQCGILTSRLVQ